MEFPKMIPWLGVGFFASRSARKSRSPDCCLCASGNLKRYVVSNHTFSDSVPTPTTAQSNFVGNVHHDDKRSLGTGIIVNSDLMADIAASPQSALKTTDTSLIEIRA